MYSRLIPVTPEVDNLLQLLCFKLNLTKRELATKLLADKLRPIAEHCKNTDTYRDLLTKEEIIDLLEKK